MHLWITALGAPLASAITTRARGAVPYFSLFFTGATDGFPFALAASFSFAAQLNGRGKTPEEREKLLRKLSGIKEPPKKKEKEKKGKADKHASKESGAAKLKEAAKAKGKPSVAPVKKREK